MLAMAPGCKKSRVTPTVEATDIQWTNNARQLRGQIGTVHAFACPPGAPTGSVWGTDIYTDDSSICTAAAHSGRMTPAGGVVQIQIGPGMPAFNGTIRNQVTSRNFAGFPGSFTIVGGPAPGLMAIPVPNVNFNGNGVNVGGVQINVANPWTANVTSHRGQIGTSFVHQCPPNGTLGSVWGTGVFTDDSSICSAATHSGMINPMAGGAVTVFVHPGRSSYQGSVANGVTSRNYATYPGSFAFTPTVPPEVAAPDGAEGITWAQTATAWRGANGSTHRVFCPPGGATGTVWGSGPYTDDSSMCTAAVHAGRITQAQGGAFTVLISRGYPRYRGSSRGGVTTSNFGTFSGSFIVMR